ncbi:epigen isoform X5 [Oryctolagus cuniculus]|uniref:epigen isoform X5 n=1 Tax=Oryctolagus cuniculus TaxID=9986 RepID=UPI0007EE714A
MQERLRELNKNLPPISLGGEEPRKQLQKMAWGVPTAVYLLFNADFREGLMALKFSHPCLEEHDSYCINGVCLFHHELEKVICRCFTGYTGERCEHLTLTSYAVDSYEKYIAIGIGVGLLLSGFLAIFYCYIRKRCLKLKSPYICYGGRPL